jgi:hypothetical protein
MLPSGVCSRRIGPADAMVVVVVVVVGGGGGGVGGVTKTHTKHTFS